MEKWMRIVGVVENILYYLLYPLFWLLSFRPLLPLQKIRDELLTYSATELATKIRNGQITCEDVISSYRFRCRRVDARLNAVVDNRYEEAMIQAHAVDKLIASGTKTSEEIAKETPLLGVPLTVKESCKVKGMSFATGCLLKKGKKAEDDGAVVALLKKAGAIPLLVSNVPELCAYSETNNKITGLTRNPYNQHRTCGGTSGGEGALIGSAGSVVGVGSDITGSIRCVAMFTGIFGHKPTPEVVPLHGNYPQADDPEFERYTAVGPMVRYAEDLPLMLNIMAGEKASELQLNKQVDISSLKILYIEEFPNNFGLIKVDSEIKERIRKAVDYLKSIGCDVQKACFEELDDAPELCTSVAFSFKGLPDVFNEIDDPKHKPNLFVEILKSCVGLSNFTLGALKMIALQRTNCLIPREKMEYYKNLNEKLHRKIVDHIGDNGIFILPTCPTAAHYNHMHLTRSFGTIYALTVATLRLPSTNIPMGLNKQGLPIGLQVAAAPYQDRICFAIAKEFESKFGGWIPPPSL